MSTNNTNNNQIDDDAVAAADKEMEERANRAKELLSQRHRSLKVMQVSVCRHQTLVYAVVSRNFFNINQD